MKKYLLPTLISIAVSSSYVLATDEAVVETSIDLSPPVVEEVAEVPIGPPAMPKLQESELYKSFQEMREKQKTFQKKMKDVRQKMRETHDLDERRKLQKEMRSIHEEMSESMRPNDMLTPPKMPPMPSRDMRWDNAPRYYGGPGNMSPNSTPPNYYGNQGNMAPNSIPPNYYGNQGNMSPNSTPPNYYGNQGNMAPSPYGKWNKNMRPQCHKNRSSMQKHRADMEKRIENIEKLLQELVDSNKKD
ncbi:MAG: hypothetical protein KAH84_08735 [Thiomargarita sp.]|nr:hypothetical protein [Thiomargarita sp.]